MSDLSIANPIIKPDNAILSLGLIAVEITMQDQNYLKQIRELSDRIVNAQRPIRILDAIKWPQSTMDAFFAAKCKELPKIDKSYYQTYQSNYDAEQKKGEFIDIMSDINKHLGKFNKLGLIMHGMCEEYIQVIDMLQARGTTRFSQISQMLYGSSSDVFYSGAPSLKELTGLISKTLEYVKTHTQNEEDIKKFSDVEAVKILNERLNDYFKTASKPIDVRLSDDIVADAAAGSEYLKLRQGAKFSSRNLRVLEVHEGWVHLGTTLNGMEQPVCTFLSKGCPSATVTQEGLAIIMELFTFASHPERMLGLSDRVHAIHLAEEGANFLEVFEFFREQGSEEEESYMKTMRVFRGSLPTLPPFTKDLVYNKGFIMIYNFIHLAIQEGMMHKVPLIFLGKLALEDISTYSELVEEGIVIPPKYIPPQFKDLAALSSWMCYSFFLNKLDLGRISQEYSSMLHGK